MISVALSRLWTVRSPCLVGLKLCVVPFDFCIFIFALFIVSADCIKEKQFTTFFPIHTAMCLKRFDNDVDDPVASIDQLNKLSSSVDSFSKALDNHIAETQETTNLLVQELTKNSTVLKEMITSLST
jgi:hypothetical protein